MTKSLVVLSGLACAFAAGCAPEGPPPGETQGRECFNARSINSFTAVGRDAVDVRVGSRRFFRLDLTGACTDIRWSQAVAVRTLGGSSWICRGVDAEVIVPSPSGTQRCLVSGVRRLSDEEARALRYIR